MSRRSWARRWRVSRAHLSDVLNGNRHLGPKLAKACGWSVRREVVYAVSSSSAAPASPREGAEVTEAMVAPFIEKLYALGYPPIHHSDARKALTAALRASGGTEGR